MSGEGSEQGGPRSATQATLRSSNLRTVLGLVLAAQRPLSRAGVSALTGMTRSTASRLVDELVAGGLLEEGDPLRGALGRPAVPLTAARGTTAALGLQLNAARTGARLVDLSGSVVAEAVDEHLPASSGPDDALAHLRSLVDTVLDRAPEGVNVVGGALSLPGVVDCDRQRVLVAPHLGWSDIQLGRLAQEVLPGLPVQVRSEAHHAARAVLEPRPGGVGEVSDAIVVYGDVGLGAALVLDGVVRGQGHGFAGGLGHVPVRPDGPLCPCGARGCLEMYAGRPALAERAGLGPGTSAGELAALAREGHEGALTALAEAGEALGTVLAPALTLTGTGALVIAGELGRLTDALRPHLQESVQARVVAGGAPLRVLQAADDLLALTGGAVSMLRPVVEDPAAYLGTRRNQGVAPGAEAALDR